MLASLEYIEEVFPHPEAERLDVAKVLGYNCVVPKDKFRGGETVVFIQPDTVLPKDKVWAETYLKYAPNRVKASKLNSKFTIWSQGIVVTLDELSEFNLNKPVGTEVSEIIGVTKYEPPLPKDMRAVGGLPYGIPKTDEERHNNLRKIPYGELVDVTRKVDGSSCTFFYNLKDDKFGITSRSLNLKLKREYSHLERTVQGLLFKLSKFKKVRFIGNLIYQLINYVELKYDLSTKFTDNEFTKVAEMLDIQAKLEAYCKQYGVSLALRGEVYGNGINASKPNLDAKKPLGFALFGVYGIDTHEYYHKDSEHYFVKVAKELDIPAVDVLELDVSLTPELIAKYAEAKDLAGKTFEGVVIKTKTFTFKVMNLHYDSQK